jgi:hypothetical protein
VSSEIVDSREAARLLRKTEGFRNYDWMIDSIIKFDEIIVVRDGAL